MAHYVVHVHIEGVSDANVETAVTDVLELHGFTKEYRFGSTELLLAPWLYGGESNVDEPSLAETLRSALLGKLERTVYVFVLHSGDTYLIQPPTWLVNTSFVYPGTH